VISLVMVTLACLVLLVALVRNHALADVAALSGLLAACAVVARFLLRDLRLHPSNFPEPSPSHGLRMGRGDDAGAAR
jgi:hypothetical protein